jgi:hypothetical protein
MLANMTRLQWSGMDSYVSTQFPPDCAIRGKRWTWDYGDGSPPESGAHVAHVYPLPGSYVVKLTFEGDDGTVGTAQQNVSINPTPTFSSYFERYCDYAAGNDATGDGSIAHPYKTIERAFHDWRTGGKLGTLNWGAIYLNKNQTHTYAGLQDATHDANPDYGPLFITAYGLGTRPVLSITTGSDFILDENHDASMDHGIQIDNIDFSWTAQTTKDFAFNHRGMQLTNSTVTNTRMVFRGANSAYQNVRNTHGGLAPFAAAGFLDWNACTFDANGTSGQGIGPGPFDHQLYMSTSCLYAGLHGCTFDQTGAVAAFAGLKTSGSRKVWVDHPICIGNDCGFDVGSNPGDQNTQDVIYESPKISTINRFGWYPATCDRISVRNPVILQGCSDSVVRLQPFSSGQRITDFQFLCGSAYKPSGAFVYMTTGPNWLTNVVFKDNAVQKAVASGNFLKTEPGIDFTGATFNGNQYFRDSGTSGQSGFASIGGTDKSFDTWKAGGQDGLSQYGDPKFNSSTDLNLQATSPCIDHGLTLNVVGMDAGGTTRPQGTAYDIGAYEFQNGTTVIIQSPVMSLGFAMSPAIIPCWSGSNQISPFMRGLQFGYSTHDAPARNFERWEDIPANFACWGNGEPLSYVDEEGVTCQQHSGRVSSTKTGPTGPTLNNFLVTEWFAKKFLPKVTAFNALLSDEKMESKSDTHGTAEDRRFFYSPSMRRVLYHPDASERQAGWDAIKALNADTILLRPFFHNSKNGNQGGPAPFIHSGGPPEEVNHNQLDQFGNARSWNMQGSKIPGRPDENGSTQWNAWDKQHNCGPPLHMAAAIGDRASMVNLWNNWRTVVTGFSPGSSDANGSQFDVPRSTGWAAFLAVYAYMAGFEWADHQMIVNHCGGAYGQNGGLGWKPSHYCDWVARCAAGIGTATDGSHKKLPDGFVYFSAGCGNQGSLSCLCDCGAMPPPGPGTSGCSGNQEWTGPDGINYGRQETGSDEWHDAIEGSALILLDSLNDYLLSIWGQQGAILSTVAASALKQLLVYIANELMYRCINQDNYAMAAYYTVTQHLESGSPTTPRGYTQSVAQAMLNDMFVCHPEKGVLCEIRQINDGSGQWIAAEIARNKVDLYYSITAPLMTYVLGPNHPMIAKWLQSGSYIPPPGQEGGDQKTNYENHARFADLAWAQLENGTAVFITSTAMPFGLQMIGNQSHPVIITDTAMALGFAIDGNYGKVVLITKSLMKMGLRMSGGIGTGVFITNATMAFALAMDGTIQSPVIITAATESFGLAMVGAFALGTGSALVHAGPLRMGLAVFYSSLKVGSAVIIVAGPISFGLSIDAGSIGLWSLSTMPFGLGLDATVQADRSVLITKQTLAFGLALKKARVVVGHKKGLDASGVAIVVEG